MKGQALADFMVECTIPHHGDEAPGELENAKFLVVNIDAAANEAGRGTGVILEFLEGLVTKHALKFGFKVTNNEVVLAVLDLDKIADAKIVHVRSNYQLVVGQSTKVYEAKDETMKQY